MPETQSAIRRYSCSDVLMTSKVTTIHDLFVDDLADFTAFDADFDAGFATAWMADIEAAMAVPSDETVQDQLAQLTEAVDTAMGLARDKWNDVKYFANKAFPDSDGKMHEFGADDYREASVNQLKMVAFLAQLHGTATTYKVELIVKKYTQGEIDEIEALRLSLFTAGRAQEDFKKKRLSKTEARIATLNKPYITMLQVNSAAQIIYLDSAAKRAQYVFDSSGGGSGNSGTEYTGDIAPSAEDTIATVPYEATRIITFENVGSTGLSFWLNVFEGENGGTLVEVAAGGVESRTMAVVNANASATKLQVQNLEEMAGSWKVTVEG